MDKVVILARGLGTRMRAGNAEADLDAGQEAVAATGVKALIPIDRPFLDYVLGDLAEAGYRRVCLVIGPEHGAPLFWRGTSLRTLADRLCRAADAGGNGRRVSCG